MSDDESTPRTGHRKPTEELTPIDLVREQVRELRKGFLKNNEDNQSIIQAVARIEGKLDLGAYKFDEHAGRLAKLETKADKSIWALLVAALGIAWTFLKDSITNGNHHP